MNTQSLYGNPAISSPKFLFVQLSQTRNRTINGHQVVIVEFRVQPLAPDFGGQFIYTNLYRTPKAEEFWQGCRSTFGFQGYEASTALGTWGKIYLVSSDWNGKSYSSVQFVGQTDIDKQKVAELTRLSEMNAVPWNARDAEEAADLVREAMAAQEGGDRLNL